MSSDPWGRVDETGIVYVRTADGEQVVGSWQAGSPEEALAYFERRYEGLVVEIGLLEKRVKSTDLPAKDAQTAIDHIREQVEAHHVVGDLDGLRTRLDKLAETVDRRREERKAQRAEQSDEVRHAKEALVAEVEQLAQSDQWRAAGERLRALVDTWKGLPRLDRKSDDELWHRFSHARSAFSKRRKAHFAQLDAQREDASKAKERLVAEAEARSAAGKLSAEALMRDMLEAALPDASDDVVAAAGAVVAAVGKREVTAADAEAMRGLLTMLGIRSEAAGGAGEAPLVERPSASAPGPFHDVQLLTVAEVASIMRVSKMTVYRLIHSGHLPAVSVGRSKRVPEQAVHEYVRENFDYRL